LRRPRHQSRRRLKIRRHPPDEGRLRPWPPPPHPGQIFVSSRASVQIALMTRIFPSPPQSSHSFSPGMMVTSKTPHLPSIIPPSPFLIPPSPSSIPPSSFHQSRFLRPPSRPDPDGSGVEDRREDRVREGWTWHFSSRSRRNLIMYVLTNRHPDMTCLSGDLTYAQSLGEKKSRNTRNSSTSSISTTHELRLRHLQVDGFMSS